MAMNCPYPDCERKSLHGTGPCPRCQRRVKGCSQCHEPNRMLAVFCRACGSRLAESPGQWLGFQGGGERRGLNAHRIELPLSKTVAQEVAQLTLEGPCLDLLIYDGFLIAVSSRGVVEATRLDGDGRSSRWLAGGGGVSAHACVAHSVLYVAGEGRLTAYSLAGLDESPAEVHELWGLPLDGVPLHALLTLGDRLFLTLRRDGGEQRVVMVGGLEPRSAPRQEIVYQGGAVSPLAASGAAEGELFFFSPGEGSLDLHTVSTTSSGGWRTHHRLVKAPGRLQEHRLLATIGTKVFAVVGDNDLLCRFDGKHGLFEEHLCPDSRSFALSGTRSGVVVQTGGVFFLPHASGEPTSDVIQSHPVLLRDRAVAVGLGDGRLRLHDLENPAAVRHLRVSNRGVTVAASAEDYVAAGCEDGVVKLWKLVERES